MQRVIRKALRDLLIVGLGAVFTYVGSNAIDLGIPAEYAPIVATASLLIWRVIRNLLGVLDKIDPQ